MGITDWRDDTSISGVGLGTAIGDLGIGHIVEGIQGLPVSAAAPAIGQAYVWNGTAWVPADTTIATPYDLGSMGAAATVDLANGTYQRGTLTADCTITDTGWTVDQAVVAVLKVTQDSPGGHAMIWDPDDVFIGDDQPGQAPDDVTFFVRWTDEGDATIYAAKIGAATTFATPAIALGTAAAAGAASTAVRSDATIVAFDATLPTTAAFGDAPATGSAAVAARRDHVHGMPAAPAASGGGPSHTHVAQEEHTSDGATVLFSLENDYEPESVTARNQTTGHWLSVVETLPNQVTVSAAGTAADVIAFAYAATVI